MAIVFIAAVLTCLLLLLVLYRNLPNKKVFYGFCLTLALSIFAIARSVLLSPAGDAPADESAIRHITAQQQIFDGWYTDYKKQLDVLDYNWAQCQAIVSDYHNDNISINTVYTRLTLLEHQAQQADESLQKLPPPISLDDTNYDLTTLLLHKTESSACQANVLRYVSGIYSPHHFGTFGTIPEFCAVAYKYKTNGCNGNSLLASGNSRAQVLVAHLLQRVTIRNI